MKVYFADGDWSIAEGSVPGRVMAEWSGIAHACGWFNKKHFTNPYQIKAQVHPICAKCHDEIPSTLVGLWKMHNWDNIQEWEHGKAEQEAMYKKIAASQSFYAQNWITHPGQVWEYDPKVGVPTFYSRPWPKSPSHFAPTSGNGRSG